MKKILSGCFVIALFIIAIACGYAQERTAKEEAFAASVKLLMDKYSASLLAGDIESWISLWDNDAVMMPTSEPYIEGIENIKGREAHFLKIAEWEIFDIQIAQTHVDENLGYVYGNYRYAYTYKTTRVRIEHYGKYADVLKRQSDGSWKIVLDISNLNM